MKFLLLPLLLPFYINLPSSGTGNEVIPYEEINLGCAITGGETFFINDNEEFKRFWVKNSKCYSFEMPKIDFDKYSLIGVTTTGSGCGQPACKETIIKDDLTNVYEVHFEITEKGICKPLYHLSKWSLVPKINGAISSVHFNVKKIMSIE